MSGFATSLFPLFTLRTLCGIFVMSHATFWRIWGWIQLHFAILCVNLQIIRTSVFPVSADMAHGVHPNFSDKHEEHHRPELQKGLVIKHNANQRYATSSVTAFLFKEVAAIHKLPVQVLPNVTLYFNIHFVSLWKLSFFCLSPTISLFLKSKWYCNISGLSAWNWGIMARLLVTLFSAFLQNCWFNVAEKMTIAVWTSFCLSLWSTL